MKNSSRNCEGRTKYQFIVMQGVPDSILIFLCTMSYASYKKSVEFLFGWGIFESVDQLDDALMEGNFIFHSGSIDRSPSFLCLDIRNDHLSQNSLFSQAFRFCIFIRYVTIDNSIEGGLKKLVDLVTDLGVIQMAFFAVFWRVDKFLICLSII